MDRLFLGVSIPAPAKKAIRSGLRQFQDSITRPIEEERWHLTLVFIGETEEGYETYLDKLDTHLPQAFVPTVSLTHIGQGEVQSQLWVYAQKTPGLAMLKLSLEERLQAINFPHRKDHTEHSEFIPHVRVADIVPPDNSFGVGDEPLAVTFTIQQVHLYCSRPDDAGVRYTIEREIALT